MNEKFLHYIWQHKLHTPQAFKTADGEIIEVIDSGKLNSDAGPDFFNAKLKIGGTLWAGNVELHINASDWGKHKHDTDSAYDSVILHVVNNIDAAVFRSNGKPILQAQLIYPAEIELRYETLLANTLWVPCANKLKDVDDIFIRSWLNATLTERLNNKSEAIFKLLDETNNNWEEAFYIALARNFGFGTNSDAFELLAKSLPHVCLGKHKDNLFQLEALLYGQSGLLHLKKKEPDAYHLSLQKEYDFLKAKFGLKPIDGKMWKMLRLRPTNFPYIRLAQFAALVHVSSKLFSKIVDNPSLKEMQRLFNCEPSDYWKSHYLFGDLCPMRSKKLGKAAIDILLINTVIPFLFCYGKSKQNENLQNKALSLLESLPAEKNNITENWKWLGIKADSAYDSQALLQLKKYYCDDKKCLRCRIGHKVLAIN